MICFIATNDRSGRTYRVDSTTMPDYFAEAALAATAAMNGQLTERVNGNWGFGIERLNMGHPFQQKASDVFAARWKAVDGDRLWAEALLAPAPQEA